MNNEIEKFNTSRCVDENGSGTIDWLIHPASAWDCEQVVPICVRNSWILSVAESGEFPFFQHIYCSTIQEYFLW